jgi:LPXTG-motif cell wall-anchored protein
MDSTMVMVVIGLVLAGAGAVVLMKKKEKAKRKQDDAQAVQPMPTPSPAPAPAPTPAPPPASAPIGVVVRNGVRLAPDVPIAEDWIPPFEASVMFGVYLPNGSACPESGIASPAGARSPKGYPMWQGKVTFNGARFANDGEVAAYIAASADRDAALAEWQRKFSAVRYIGTSGVDAASTTQPERAYLWERHHGFNGDLWRLVLSGPNIEMSRAINDGCYIGGPTEPVRKELVDAVTAAFDAQARGEVPAYRTA